MRLHWSPRSPFVRKVMIVLYETGQASEVDLIRTPVSFVRMPPAAILRDNPLGKVPTLVLDNGTAFYDSPVICAHLDGFHDGPRLLPPGAAGLRHRRWEALGDGIAEMLIRWQLERVRPGPTWTAALAGLEAKLRAALARVEAELPALRETNFGLGHVALFCALGQLDFRFDDSRWREAFPDAAIWHDEIGERPAVQAAPLTDESDAPSRGAGPAAAALDFLAPPREAVS